MENKQKEKNILSAILLTLNAIFLITLIIGIPIMNKRFVNIFNSMNVATGSLTAFALNINYIFVPTLMFLLAKELLINDKKIILKINIVILIVSWLLLSVYIAGMFFPMFNIQQLGY